MTAIKYNSRMLVLFGSSDVVNGNANGIRSKCKWFQGIESVECLFDCGNGFVCFVGEARHETSAAHARDGAGHEYSVRLWRWLIFLRTMREPADGIG